jgi:osmotically-inducible protein OsmY
MKTALLFLLIGVVAGVFGWRYYERTQNPTLRQRAGDWVDKTREAASSTKEAVASKAEDWKLDSASIKDELAKTGRVVRSKAKEAGEVIGDARIIAVIKGKYVVQKELSAFAITVDCTDGKVLLTGSVTSPEHIGKAVTLALETGGVHDVVSQLVVKN